MQWSAQSNSTWTQPEVGNWPATCIRIIDLGTQQREYQGKESWRRQSLIIWELDGQQDSEGKPLTISKAYTSSLGEKANLRKDLESWRGRKFTDEELAGFNVRKILGAPCLLNLITVQGKKGDKVVIASISALPKGMPSPSAPMNEQYIYSLEEHDPSVWDKLSDGIKNWINRSQERAQAPVQATAPAPTAAYGNADDIPF